MSPSDVLGLTSEDLLYSIELQQDIDLRNTLQQSMGELTNHKIAIETGEIKSLAQMRREAQIKRFLLPHKTNSHIPIVRDEASFVTPVKLLGKSTKSRWYRNSLSDLHLPKQVPRFSSDTKPSSFNPDVY